MFRGKQRVFRGETDVIGIDEGFPIIAEQAENRSFGDR